MKEFIEFVESEKNSKVCCSVFNILAVFEESDGKAFVHMHMSRDDNEMGFYTVETYDEIIAKMQEC